MLLDGVQGQHAFLGDLLVTFANGKELQDVEFAAGATTSVSARCIPAWIRSMRRVRFKRLERAEGMEILVRRKGGMKGLYWHNQTYHQWSFHETVILWKNSFTRI